MYHPCLGLLGPDFGLCLGLLGPDFGLCFGLLGPDFGLYPGPLGPDFSLCLGLLSPGLNLVDFGSGLGGGKGTWTEFKFISQTFLKIFIIIRTFVRIIMTFSSRLPFPTYFLIGLV